MQVCRSKGMSLATWSSGLELYETFEGSWEATYAPEFWVGAVRPVSVRDRASDWGLGLALGWGWWCGGE